jgi:hypothetical protein
LWIKSLNHCAAPLFMRKIYTIESYLSDLFV